MPGDLRPPSEPIDKVAFGRLMQLTEDNNKRLEHIEAILIGDGSGGLVRDTNTLKVEMLNLKESTGRVKTFVYSIIASLLLSGVGVAVALLTHRIIVTFP